MLSEKTFLTELGIILIAKDAETQKKLIELGYFSIVRDTAAIGETYITFSYPQAIACGLYDISNDEIPDMPTLHRNVEYTPVQQLETLFNEYPRIQDTPISYSDGAVKFRTPPVVHKSVDKLILMSATAETEIIKDKVFPDRECEVVDTDYAKWESENSVFQVINGKYPRRTVMADGRLNATGDKILDRMLKEIDRTPERKHAVISFKSVTDSLNHAYPQVVFAHYGATEGENEKFAGCDTFWVLFDFRKPGYEIAQRAKMFYGKDAEPLDYHYNVETGKYVDKRLQYLSDSDSAAELIQAIGRARLVRRSGVRVVIFCGRDIPGVSGRDETELFDWKDWDKSPEGLDTLSETIAKRQGVNAKAVEMLTNGESHFKVVRETGLSRRDVAGIMPGRSRRRIFKIASLTLYQSNSNQSRVRILWSMLRSQRKLLQII